MREILLCVLLMFPASLFAAEGERFAPDGWYTVDAVDMVGVDALTDVAAAPERLSGLAVEQTNGKETAVAKLIGEPSCCFIGAFAPIEVGWR